MKQVTTSKTSWIMVWLLAWFTCFASVTEVLPQPKIPRVAMLLPGSTSHTEKLIEAFLSGLKDVGLTAGSDLVIENHYAGADVNRYREICRRIVALQPSVIVVASTPLIDAVIRETKNIPIVMAAAADPLASGIVSSLSRPGGNVTGMSMRSPEVSGKRLELIKALLPNARRVIAFLVPTNHSHAAILKDSGIVAQALNLELLTIAVQTPSTLDSAFKSALAMKADVFTLFRDALFLRKRKQVVEFATQNKIPAVYDGEEFALAGGLMSYTPNLLDLYRRAAPYVKKILDGANPGDLPIERTMRAEFIINLKAARQIGLTIPPEMLMLADQVIE